MQNLNFQDKKTEGKEGESYTKRKKFSFQLVKVPKSFAPASGFGCFSMSSVFGRFSMSVQNKGSFLGDDH